MDFCTFSEDEKRVLKEVVGLYKVPEGAYNFRLNGKSVGHNSSANIDVTVTDSELVADIKPGTKNESIHVPVIISKSGHKERVKNTFNIGDGAEVSIISGCGIYNCGGGDTEHSGLHVLNIGKNAHVKYFERHYGSGNGRGAKVLNPTTKIILGEGSTLEMDLEQYKGVDSTIRRTDSVVGDRAKLVIKERLLTHGRQTANSVIETKLEGEDSIVDIISRAVAQDVSRQDFTSVIYGENKCRGHSECDAIIMDEAQVLAVPSLDARNVDAELIHEAAIGKIAGDQILKFQTLGLTQADAESLIINGFLN